MPNYSVNSPLRTRPKPSSHDLHLPETDKHWSGRLHEDERKVERSKCSEALLERYAVKHSRRKLSQVIKHRLTYGRNTPWQASNCKRKLGRDVTWTLRGMPAPGWVVENLPGSAKILAVRCKGARDGKSVDEIRY